MRLGNLKNPAREGDIMSTKARATIEDLHRVDGKAELVNGEIVCMSPTGSRPGRAGGEIYVSLRQHERQYGGGYAFPDNVGFVVHLPHRESFSPDTARYAILRRRIGVCG